ncbi:glycosyltransferase family 39 protein [Chloroflexus aggregans]|uniref:Glycosyltransferase RgtA/B/C/D-like domain-containing protein n=1 Tax=Chloroflexus aggregans (strain MD-66 / DSM 9485) TaxID=326427 RepID=B8G8U3_CHLAD|nr:glycosyltransferase family 39 protein [Chloroflexus aggregans]ACL26218.1 conserved hypothetical protein [Chloroflexus aggregans DSM 9485]
MPTFVRTRLVRWMEPIRTFLTGREFGPFVIVLVFVVILPISLPRIALSDEVQYYAYLRSLYFDHDLDFYNEYQHFATIGLQRNDPAVFNALLRPDAANPNPVTGKLRNVAPVGSAILWLPGFFLADVWVQVANTFGAEIARDGFSPPYLTAVCFMSALYSLAGLLLTYRLARIYTGQLPALLATLTIFLATPLVFYTYLAMAWSHANGFFLFALFLTIWLRGREGNIGQSDGRRHWSVWLALGIVAGLMVMTREQLGLLLIIPAFEALAAYIGALRRRQWAVMRELIAGHAVFVGVFILALTPQLAAYWVLNGRLGPSTTVGSKLAVVNLGPFPLLVSPRFFDTLLDPAHGAFLWSPILVVALIGLLWLFWRDGPLALLLLTGFLAQVYINGAFGTTWHLSGSFGFRRLIECTPIFTLGLAALIAWLQSRVGWKPLLIGSLIFVAWNVGLIAQWTFLRTELRKGLIWEGMLYYQLQVPLQILLRLSDILFNRCRLIINC